MELRSAEIEESYADGFSERLRIFKFLPKGYTLGVYLGPRFFVKRKTLSKDHNFVVQDGADHPECDLVPYLRDVNYSRDSVDPDEVTTIPWMMWSSADLRRVLNPVDLRLSPLMVRPDWHLTRVVGYCFIGDAKDDPLACRVVFCRHANQWRLFSYKMGNLTELTLTGYPPTKNIIQGQDFNISLHLTLNIHHLSNVVPRLLSKRGITVAEPSSVDYRK